MEVTFSRFRTNRTIKSFTSNDEYHNNINRNKDNVTDTFTNTSKTNKSNNGKFDFSEAAKNLGKGIISPLTAVIKHPIAAIGMVAATVAATTLVPVLGPIMAVGFGAYSVYQVGKGTYEAAKNYKNGNYDDAEKSFDKIGQGVVGTVLSALGLKQGAKIAKEAKLMNELNTNSLTNAQRTEIASSVDNAGIFSALKENISLLTSKSGLKSVMNQFKPSMVKARITDIVETFKGNRNVVEEKEVTTKKRMTPEEFKKSPEGIRRAALTDEQIEQEVNALYNESFEKLGIQKEQRPNLKIQKGPEKHGGGYTQAKHELEFNPESYKAGIFDIENTMMHEATHCKEALLRAGIPQDRVNQIVKEQLISRVINGESESILVKGNFFGADMMKPPKMSPKMKQEFVSFAENDLYQDKIHADLVKYVDAAKSKNLGNAFNPTELVNAKQKAQPFLDKLDAMIARNPEFAQQFKNSDEALDVLAEYSVSHNVRYNIFTNQKINKGNIYKPDYVNVPELSGEKLIQAEKSLVDNIATIEGNAEISGVRGMFASNSSFNQYQFSPEEVLAQKNGNSFLIEKCSAKIAEMRANGTLTPQEEARLTKIIDKAKAVIEYKEKGLEYYEQYTQLINNPADANLVETVKSLESELNALKSKMSTTEYETITEQIKVIHKGKDVATTMLPLGTIYSMFAEISARDSKVA